MSDKDRTIEFLKSQLKQREKTITAYRSVIARLENDIEALKEELNESKKSEEGTKDDEVRT